MTITARYTWGKTERGYGWNGWTEPGLSLEKNGQTGNWEVYEADGSLLCRCASYKDAQRVVARLRRLVRAQVTPDALPEFAYIAQGKQGWIVHHVAIVEDYGKTFPTRDAAEAYLVSRELVPNV